MKNFKKQIILIIGFCLAMPLAPLYAQNNDQMELTRTVVQTKRKVIIAKAMQLSEAESQAFWPVYNAYWNDMNKINDRSARLISDYADNYQALSEDKSKIYLKEYMAIEQDKLRLRKRYVSKFNKILPPNQVLRYFQAENKLDAIVKYDLARAIPLAK